MSPNPHNRSLLTLSDLKPEDVRLLLNLAAELKHSKYAGSDNQRLKGKKIALIFEKPSTRTRCAFEVAVYDEGGHLTYIDPASSHLGHKESLKDTARVLGRLYDGIVYRGFQQSVVEELAKYSNVPVWNGLTDTCHPTQALADLLTMGEFGLKPLNQLSFCYLGDACSNVANSLLIGGVQMGMDVRFSAPESFFPNANLVSEMKQLAIDTGAKITLEEDPLKAVSGVDFVYTDVWVSMGDPIQSWEERIHLLRKYQVTKKLMQATGNPLTKFMHCLPAFHNLGTELGRELHEKFGLMELEVTDEVFESEASIVFHQAENRMHTIKAVLVATLAD
ncbi:MAG TPA: ornithine carbamoyltransferase [Gammaproteobacteria bacterium]|nr:ornithine carbamoyltransferase [Gammaproteobacteria bacterium]